MFRIYICASVAGFLFVLSSQDLRAQSSRFYTVIQAGGIYGVHTTSALKPMHGFQFQLVFGRNFRDKAYLGIGVGNDTYRGKTQVENGNIVERRIQTFPLFADFRAPLFEAGMLGRVTAFANAGYAPNLSAQYMQGSLAKLGLSYEHLLAYRSNLKFSVGYGIQNFNSRNLASRFSQQQITLNIGLFVL